MATFNYIARNQVGRVLRGEIDAGSLVELRSALNAMDLKLLSFEVKSTWFRSSAWRKLLPSQWLPAKTRHLELALYQLAIMLRSGLRLLDALKSLEMQAERRAMTQFLAAVHARVRDGSSLAEALNGYRFVPAVVVQLVDLGERTGRLDKVLVQASDYMRQRRTTTTEVRIAIAYPACVVIAAFALAIYLVLVVLPQLESFLATIGRKLPAMTQVLIDLAQWLRFNGPFLILALTGVAVVFTLLAYSKRGRLAIDRYALKLPLIGGILRLAGTAALANSLAVMLASGVRLVDAVKIANRIQSNSYLASLLRSAATTVARGQPLAPALAHKDGFVPILASMVEVAEQAGNMDKTIHEVADFCDSELKTRLKRLTQMIEPAVIVVAGLTVGYVYVAFFVALMSVSGGMR